MIYFWRSAAYIVSSSKRAEGPADPRPAARIRALHVCMWTGARLNLRDTWASRSVVQQVTSYRLVGKYRLLEGTCTIPNRAPKLWAAQRMTRFTGEPTSWPIPHYLHDRYRIQPQLPLIICTKSVIDQWCSLWSHLADTAHDAWLTLCYIRTLWKSIPWHNCIDLRSVYTD